MTYHGYQKRLADIEQEMSDKQPDYEKYAENAVRTDKQFALRMAQGKLQAKGATETEKKDKVLVEIASAGDDFWTAYVEGQALYEGRRALMKTLESRAMIGMALLKAQQREVGG